MKMHALLPLVPLLVACSATASGPHATTTDPGAQGADTLASDVTPTADGAALPDGAECAEGQLDCISTGLRRVCSDGHWIFGDECPAGTFCLEGACATAATCTPGAITGCEGVASEFRCSGDGKALVPHACPSGQMCAAGTCREVSCTPGNPVCTGLSTFQVCRPDGSGYGAEADCTTGAMCVGGTCVSLCETNLKFASNVGCEYWSVDLDNDPTANPAFPAETPEMFPHSVVITNPGIFDAELTFTLHAQCAGGMACEPSKSTCGAPKTVCDTPGPAYEIAFVDNVVPHGESREFKMPVMNADGSSLAPKAVHVQSTQPVVAFQFNPFDSENAASNDGSLLLPQNTLGKLHYAVSLPSTPPIAAFPNLSQHGFLTVVATLPGTTTVHVTPRATLMASAKAGVPPLTPGDEALPPGQPYTFKLAQFDVLNLEQLGLTGSADTSLTGTRIEADKPVAVFSGHENAGVHDKNKKGDEAFDTCCTEHLEEQLMPVSAWGAEALCVKSKTRGYDVDVWVVVAGEDGVGIVTKPAIPGLHGEMLAKAGDSLKVQTDESFQILATGKIQVVQFLVGSGQTGDKVGDPSMMLVPPKKQYRADYVIQTAGGYSANWTSVVRPKGVDVEVDGMTIASAKFQAFGDGTWEYAWQSVGKGTHTFKAKEAFGLMVYGYGSVTAYGYPGGMNLGQ